ncbi:MAG: hypothetical protein AAF974_10720 [Cyanobacteria bacterium P01_E01_bin.34]
MIVTTRGSRDLVYVDESGFELDSPYLYGWAPRGVRGYGEGGGSRRPRQNSDLAPRDLKRDAVVESKWAKTFKLKLQ